MSASAQRDSVGEPRLMETLSLINQSANETRLAFLGRLQIASNFYADVGLRPDQFNVAERHLADWVLGSVWRRKGHYVLAQRQIEVEVEAPDFLNELSNERRLVGFRHASKIAVLAAPTFTGSDLGAIYRIEEAIERQAPEPVEEAVLEPEPYAGLALSPREREVISLYAYPLSDIAAKMDITAVTVSRLFGNALARNNMNKEELLLAAAGENIIDMSPLPPEELPAFTPRQQEVLADALRPYEETAKRLNIHWGTVSRHWHRIREGTPATSRAHIFLMALRDGRIDTAA